jgi:ATP-dependent 26S proteasome regulatory subunit
VSALSLRHSRTSESGGRARSSCAVRPDANETVGVLVINRSEIMSKLQGKLHEVSKEAASKSSSIVFIDESTQPREDQQLEEQSKPIRRFGRFDRAVLAIQTMKMKLNDDVNLESLQTHRLVGTDLAQPYTEAAMLCIRESWT